MPTTRALSSLILALFFTLSLSACGGPAVTPTARSTATPVPSATSGAIATPVPGAVPADRAAAAVLAADPRFLGFMPYDPAIPGQTRWYEMTADGTTWNVTVTVGWGDCQAGCAHQHAWHYQVVGDGQVKLVDESGEGLPTDIFPSPANGIARYNLVTNLPGVVFRLARFGNDAVTFQIVTGVDGKSRGSVPGGVYVLSTVSRPDAGTLPAPFALSLAPDADNLLAVDLASLTP